MLSYTPYEAVAGDHSNILRKMRYFIERLKVDFITSEEPGDTCSTSAKGLMGDVGADEI